MTMEQNKTQRFSVPFDGIFFFFCQFSRRLAFSARSGVIHSLNIISEFRVNNISSQKKNYFARASRHRAGPPQKHHSATTTKIRTKSGPRSSICATSN